MTELLIDGQQVALPNDLVLKLKEQNPYITKNGVFTLDLNLSLEERNNALLYKHLERLHSSAAFNERKALLLSDNKVILNGIEAIQGNTDKKVSIQLLSGNSELNYFINSETFITDLHLGSAPELTDAYFNSIIDKKYPAADFAPAMVKIDTQIYNRNSSVVSGNNYVYTFQNHRIQPYMVAMLVKVIQSLGYVIKQNELLQDDALCQLFILNNVPGQEYNKFLPGWTAKAFLEECEKFLNITFYIDPKDKSVEILKRRTVANKGTYVIDNVFDDYERLVTNEKADLSYKNVEYEFPSTTWYKYADIDPDILGKAEVTTFNTFDALRTSFGYKLEDPWTLQPNAEKAYKKLKMYYVTETNTYFLIDKFTYAITGPGETGGGSWFYLRPVNRFKKYVSDPDADSVKLKFIPAQMIILSTGTVWVISTNTIPYQSEKVEQEDEVADITKYIENGIKDYNSSQKKVCLAYYTGSRFAFKAASTQIDYFHENPTFHDTYTPGDTCTLRLDGEQGMVNRYYKASDIYDFSKEYVIRFLIRTMPNVRANFLFKNKLFICKELEYTILNDGIGEVVSGVFYAIK